MSAEFQDTLRAIVPRLGTIQNNHQKMKMRKAKNKVRKFMYFIDRNIKLYSWRVYLKQIK
jgi:hypothetical protein